MVQSRKFKKKQISLKITYIDAFKYRKGFFFFLVRDVDYFLFILRWRENGLSERKKTFW